MDLRLLRGESVDALSRDLNYQIYRLEQWPENYLLSPYHSPSKPPGEHDGFRSPE